MPMSSSLARGAASSALLGALRSNGFANRRLILTPGPVDLLLPGDPTDVEIAVFGAGGSGALLNIGSSVIGAPGGGAGGGYSRKRWRGLPRGARLTGVVGAGGAAPVAPNGDKGQYVGNNGGTTTATLNGETIAATGGGGGTITVDANPVAAQGGVGSGGDRNARGGNGGLPDDNIAGRPDLGCFPAGGGASGSHLGNGGNGGNGRAANAGANYYGAAGSGGGWGGRRGADYLMVGDSSSTHMTFGASPLAPGKSFSYPTNAFELHSLFATPADAPFDAVLQRSATNSAQYPGVQAHAPRLTGWWDEDEDGHGSSGFITMSQRLDTPWPGGKGAGGSAWGAWAYQSRTAPAGFGGGASGVDGSAGADNLQRIRNGFHGTGGIAGGGGGVCLSGSGNIQGLPALGGAILVFW